MIAPCGIEIKVGQVWQEVDPRFERLVKVFGLIESINRVQVRRVDSAGTYGMLTNNMLRRFHGKRGGYKLVQDVQP